MVLGWDVAGVVVDVGSECRYFKPGDKVFYAGDINRPGGYSEYHKVDERLVGLMPKSLSYSQAAALPLTSLTAWEGLFNRLGISMNSKDNLDKSILIIGAAGGVGSIAVQLAQRVGLTVIGTFSRFESFEWLKKLGVEHTAQHDHPLDRQLTQLGMPMVDYIFCLHDTDQYWNQMAEVIEPQGKICSIVEPSLLLDLSILQTKSITFAWEYIFTRPTFHTDDMHDQRKILNQLSAWIDDGRLKTTLTKNFGAICSQNLDLAHQRLKSNHVIGKLVLESFD
ncbi:zinc-binding alcohol dehydrogenase family protein [Seinonella peptonophila]|uniref:Zinc-type alcohol dehydrogenase-like protein n=2 Tax=Seinonella peptonophila TaxID=112248 RepID=A0A1M4ZZR8_9BACL|nr:zinc-binding alcohol dehydrogenase family protein [Seinonella peptonophila]